MENPNLHTIKDHEKITATKKYVNASPNAPLYSRNDEWKKQTAWLHSAEAMVHKKLGIVIGSDKKTYKSPLHGNQPHERVYISIHMTDLFKTSFGPIKAAEFLLTKYTKAHEARIESMEYLEPKNPEDTPRIKIKLTNTHDFVITFRTDTFPKRSIKNIKRLPQELFDGDFWLQSDSGDDNEVLERLKNGETITAITIELEGASHRKEQAQGRIGKMMVGVGTAPGRQRKIPKNRPEDSLHESDRF